MNKAFDKINHTKLLEKLSRFGISPKFLNLINSVLSGRKQIVRYNSCLPDMADVRSGVPQVSVLTPLLFAVYINDLLKKDFINKIVCYADDIKLAGAPSDSLNTNLRVFAEWMLDNYMSVNTSKCETIHFGKNNPCRKYCYQG